MPMKIDPRLSLTMDDARDIQALEAKLAEADVIVKRLKSRNYVPNGHGSSMIVHLHGWNVDRPGSIAYARPTHDLVGAVSIVPAE